MKKEAVMSWLRSHEQEQIEFLQQMIRIPSVTGNEGPIQEFMAKTLTEMGLAVDLFVPSLEELQKHPAYVAPAQPYEGRPDVVGTLKGAGGGRSLRPPQLGAGGESGAAARGVRGPGGRWGGGCGR